MVTVTDMSLDDRSSLMQFGSSGIELLALDDLWTEAAASGDQAAVEAHRKAEEEAEKKRDAVRQLSGRKSKRYRRAL